MSEEPHKKIKYNTEYSRPVLETIVHDTNERILNSIVECTYWDYRLALLINSYFIEFFDSPPLKPRNYMSTDKFSLVSTISLKKDLIIYLAKAKNTNQRYTVFRTEGKNASKYQYIQRRILSKFSGNVVQLEQIQHRFSHSNRHIVLLYMNELKYNLEDRLQFLKQSAAESQIIILEFFRALAVTLYLISMSAQESICLGELDLFNDYWINSEDRVSVILREATEYSLLANESQKLRNNGKLIQQFEEKASSLKKKTRNMLNTGYYVHILRVLKLYHSTEEIKCYRQTVNEMVSVIRRINTLLIYQAESRGLSYRSGKILELGLPSKSISYENSAAENKMYFLSNRDPAVSSTVLGNFFDIFENYRHPTYFRFLLEPVTQRRLFKEIIFCNDVSNRSNIRPEESSFFTWNSEEAVNRFEDMIVYGHIDESVKLKHLLKAIEPISTLNLESSYSPFIGGINLSFLSKIKLTVLKLEIERLTLPLRNILRAILAQNECLVKFSMDIRAHEGELSLNFLSDAKYLRHLDIIAPNSAVVTIKKQKQIHLADRLESIGLARVQFKAAIFSDIWRLKRLSLCNAEILPDPLSITQCKIPRLEHLLFRYKTRSISAEIFDIICSELFMESFPSLQRLELSFAIAYLPKNVSFNGSLEEDLLIEIEEEQKQARLFENDKQRQMRPLSALRIEDTNLGYSIDKIQNFGAFYALEEIILFKCELQADFLLRFCEFRGFEKLRHLDLSYNNFSQLTRESIKYIDHASFIKSLIYFGLDYTSLSLEMKHELTRYPYPRLKVLSLKDCTHKFKPVLSEGNSIEALYISDREMITRKPYTHIYC